MALEKVDPPVAEKEMQNPPAAVSYCTPFTLSCPKRSNPELSTFEEQAMQIFATKKDENYYFCMGPAATLRRLPPAKRHLLQRNIDDVVYRTEFER